jgi:hypothetical protein
METGRIIERVLTDGSEVYDVQVKAIDGTFVTFCFAVDQKHALACLDQLAAAYDAGIGYTAAHARVKVIADERRY